MSEMPLVPFAAAVASAIHAATGAWVYAVPFTPERVLATRSRVQPPSSFALTSARASPLCCAIDAFGRSSAMNAPCSTAARPLTIVKIDVSRTAEDERGERIVHGAAGQRERIEPIRRRDPPPCPARDSRCRRVRALPRRRASPSAVHRARSSPSRPPATRCSSIACRTSSSRCELSLEAEPSTPRPTRAPARAARVPARSRCPDACSRWDSARRRCASRRARGISAARDAPCARATRRRRSSPAVRQVRPAAAEALEAKRSSSSVSARCVCACTPLTARKRDALAHQVGRDRERRTRRDARCASSRSAPHRDTSRSRAACRRRIAASSSTQLSGGRPPCDRPTDIEPREA